MRARRTIAHARALHSNALCPGITERTSTCTEAHARRSAHKHNHIITGGHSAGPWPHGMRCPPSPPRHGAGEAPAHTHCRTCAQWARESRQARPHRNGSSRKGNTGSRRAAFHETVGYELNKHEATLNHGPPWPKACAARRSEHVHGARWRGPHTRTLCPTCALRPAFPGMDPTPALFTIAVVRFRAATNCMHWPACWRNLRQAEAGESVQLEASVCSPVSCRAGTRRGSCCNPMASRPNLVVPQPQTDTPPCLLQTAPGPNAPIQKGYAVKLIGTPNHILV